jgi:hypothetical protein
MGEEHPFHHQKVEGLNTTHGNDREKLKISIWLEIRLAMEAWWKNTHSSSKD